MISFIIGSAKPMLAAIFGLGRHLAALDGWLRSCRILSEMTERDLRDLGLRDSDLRGTRAAPFFGDPTAIISMPTEERRSLSGGEKRRRGSAQPERRPIPNTTGRGRGRQRRQLPGSVPAGGRVIELRAGRCDGGYNAKRAGREGGRPVWLIDVRK